MEMFMAEVTYEINQYEDCLEYLIPLMRNSSDVNIYKIKMWSNCYKQIINKKRSAWRHMLKQENCSDLSSYDWSIFNEYKLSISSDIKLTCNEIILFINDHLMGAIKNVDHKVLMYQICGDYHRYKAEVCNDKIKLYNHHKALNEFKSGWMLCLKNTVSAVIILYFAVKYAICLEFVHGPNKALSLIMKALSLTNQNYSSIDEPINVMVDRVIIYKQTLINKIDMNNVL
ncbi:14-3-3 protein homolog [Sipha flava]|jgi:hypothetical protein|uniref:14-3-3 protein homolog n=1 Tax=Sipha flava TaxID=143950 RepID=A0A8B8FNN6_9HEMI|nr:14-3-3 protein homolog [Sipha flava]